MRKQILFAMLAVSLLIQLPAFAQLAAPNDDGVSIGHIHLLVRDIEAQKKVWVEGLGAEVTKTGTLEMLRLPGVFIIFTKGEPTAGSDGSTVNHIGFQVKDQVAIKAKLAAVNVQIQGIFAAFPDGVRIELLEDKAQTSPVVMHHIHMSTPMGEQVRQWYVKTFGAGVGSRRNLPAAMFNGNEVDFLPAQMPTAATKGRAIDHIGFEVKNLKAFCDKLAATGVMFERPYTEISQIGLKIAFVVDPIGTRIELTEGLAGK
jgi:catechol 2,3-dioxygenase-like lactoylglutathione lyase family enzyme